MSRVLSHEQARAFYDRFGAKQDLQRIYENAAIDSLLRNGAFESSRSVVEFGCGTGALAKQMLQNHLQPAATYLGVDVSSTMVDLARQRLGPWSARARVELTTGEALLPVPDASCDRFVSTYVFDLLSEADIHAALMEAKRALAPGGLICLTSLTFGQGLMSRAICRLWCWIHERRPQLVGGCRPLRLTRLLGEEWLVVHQQVICAFGICSEVVVAGVR
jgi:ubiquinone/menaquinone biosynthesis C-methylase UbiE